MAFQKAFRRYIFISTVVLLHSSIGWCFPQKDLENLQVLEMIEKSLNSSVNPCNDFYGYACGNWAQHYATEDVLEMTTLLNSRFEAAVEHMIQHKYPNQKFISQRDQNFIDKALSYYYSCINSGDLELFKYIREIELDHKMEWPLQKELLAAASNNSHPNDTHQGAFADVDIFGLLGSLHSYKFDKALISLAFESSYGFRKIQLQIPATESLNSTDVITLLLTFGFPKEVVVRLTRQILDTDNYWKKAYEKYSFNDDGSVTTFGEIQYLYPSIGKFLENVFPFEIPAEDLVFFSSLSYIEFLVGHKWKPIQMAKICNYLLVKFLLHLSANSEEKCATWLRRKMPLAVNYMYHGNIYQPESKQYNSNMTSLTQVIHKYLLKTLDRNRMHYTAQQSQAIRQKIHEIVLNVGNLPEDVNYTQVDAFYADVPDLDVNNFYKNDLLLLKHQFMESETCFRQMVCDPSLDSSPMNYILLNLVVVPMATLQPPLYHYNLHPLFTFSLLGFIMGHEITHAIDPDTIAVDTDHFSPLFEGIAETSPHFNASLECMKNQHYTEFFGERVADFVGTHVAYQAYDKDFHLQPSFTKIPWQQLFFLNLAQFFCGSNTLLIESHDTDAVRVNQIAMNSEEFAQAFQCPGGSEMNPLEKCHFY